MIITRLAEINFIGKTYAAAVGECKEKSIKYRFVRDGDDHYMVTCDCQFDRYNFELDNGIITKQYIG